MRVTLLWTEGTWQFDDRVRLTAADRVPLDVSRFLLECARHLPFSFVRARFNGNRGSYSFGGEASSMKLLPVEATVMSRAAAAGTSITIEELTTNGKSRDAVISADGKVTSTRLQNPDESAVAIKAAAALSAQPAEPAPPFALRPDRMSKFVVKSPEKMAIVYWGGTLRIADPEGKVKAEQRLPQDISAIAWSGNELLAGLADGRVVSLIVP